MSAPCGMNEPMPDELEIQRRYNDGNRERAFRDDLEQLINKHSRENASNTPDFILANYLHACLQAFEAGVNARAQWQT